MALETIESLAVLYREDETAWLDLMAEIAQRNRAEELDLPNLAEYLADMARRDRREVESRLIVLLSHLLKWEYQPTHRSRSWRGTVIEQRQELESLLQSGVLRNHADDILSEVYTKAVERASGETGLAPALFPTHCPFTLKKLLVVDLAAEIL